MSVNKSLRRHNKLKHAGTNGVLHLGNGEWKRKKNVCQFETKLVHSEKINVTLGDFFKDAGR